MDLPFFIKGIISIPIFPILYFQSKSVRSKIPSLPEAEGTSGNIFIESNKSFKLLIIGESTMAGVGVKTHEEGFAGALAKEISYELQRNINWKVYAKSGITAKRVGEELIPSISEKTADLIVIGLGANDAFALNPPSKWATEIKHLIQILGEKFPETPIVFLNMPPIQEFPAFTKLMQWFLGHMIDDLGKELKKLSEDLENVFFNAERITLDGWMKKYSQEGKATDFFSDGLHPSKLTYELWAKDYYSFILSHNIIFRNLSQKERKVSS